MRTRRKTLHERSGEKMKKKIKKTVTSLLRTKRNRVKDKNTMREEIIKAMSKKGWTAYRLSKEVAGKVSAQAVYDFAAGRRDMSGRYLCHLFMALGLEIREKESTDSK